MKLNNILEALVESIMAGDQVSAKSHFSNYAMAKVRERLHEADFGSFQPQAGRSRGVPTPPNRNIAPTNQSGPITTLTFTMFHQAEGGQAQVVRKDYASRQEYMRSEEGRHERQGKQENPEALIQNVYAALAQQVPSYDDSGRDEDGDGDEHADAVDAAVSVFGDKFRGPLQLLANNAIQGKLFSWSVDTDLNYTIVINGKGPADVGRGEYETSDDVRGVTR